MNIRINYKFEPYLKCDDGSWGGIDLELPQHKVFRTKEELLKSL